MRADGSSLVQVGPGAPLGTGVRVQPRARLTAHGGRIEADVANGGTILNDGALTITGSLSGAGALGLAGGVTEIDGSVAGAAIAMSGAGTVLPAARAGGRVHPDRHAFGETVDLAGITGAALSGNTVTADQGTLALAPAPSGYEYKLYGDANGGTNLLLHPLAAPTAAVSFTDTTAGSSGGRRGRRLFGPCGLSAAPIHLVRPKP